MKKYRSIFSIQISPLQQASLVVFAALLIMLGLKILISAGWVDNKPPVYWEAAFTMLMIYMLFTAVWSITNKKKSTYLMYSIAGYVFVAVVTGWLAAFLSGYSMDEAGSFRWLYVIFTVSYLIFMGIVNAMRKILEIVKKQDARLRGEVEEDI